MSLTISPSPFGSLVVSVAETGSTLSVTTVATAPAVLTMALGVPGPTGATGATGAAGTNGTNGVGVPVGGTTGQALVKLSGTNYDTGWATITSGGGTWGSITGTLSNQTDLQTALNGKLSLSGGTVNGDVTFNNGEGNHSFYSDADGFHFTGTSQIWTDGDRIYFSPSGSGVLELHASGITFPNGSFQDTAFPGYTGTTSQYIRGDGSVATYGPLGDRYLTSSTSTLTCDSGNGKTMTIGTGLSYSRQQDITVSYNTSNHMHGTVLTYDSTTGVMTFDSNTHSGSGTYSSWEVNVGGVAGAILPVGGTSGQVLAKVNSTNFNTEWISLGSMAQATTTDYLAKADNLSGLSSTSTARTNLGLGSMATATASDYLAKADNLSGLASTSTARTNLGLGAVSTDAYATTAQAQAGTSTTTVISPSTLLDAKYFQGGKFFTGITWSTATSGTGASAGTNGINARVATAPTTATGYAQNHGAVINNTRGGSYNAGIDWSKRVAFGGRISRNVVTPDSNSILRLSLGRFSAQVPSDIVASDKQIGIKIAGSGAIQLLVANGSTLTTTTSSYTPSNSSAYDVLIVSDNAGGVTLYVNGSSVATSTGGPTSSQGTNYATMSFEVQNSSTLTNGNMVAFISDAFAQVNL
jgi:hypothetical protein